MASKEETSTALVTLPADVPQLPDLKGKTGKASVKASEEQSSVAEMHKQVSNFFYDLEVLILGGLIPRHDRFATYFVKIAWKFRKNSTIISNKIWTYGEILKITEIHPKNYEKF